MTYHKETSIYVSLWHSILYGVWTFTISIQ